MNVNAERPAAGRSTPVLLSPKQLKEVQQSGRAALVEFYSPTCPHCAALQPVMDQLADEWGERVLIAQIDITEHPRLASQWTVMGTPTVVVLANGEEVARLTGVQSRRDYERELNRVV